MKLISNNNALLEELSRLIDGYPNIAFAVAWATTATPVYQRLLRNSHQISKAVIGTHFYQTHPDVLDAFTDSDRVRFKLQPSGVFHPKIYVFWNSTQWELIIGSANLTSGAVTANSEVVLLIASSDEGAAPLKDQVITLMEDYWVGAVSITGLEASRYREIWKSQQRSLRRLANHYGMTKNRKLPTASLVKSMSWEEFLARVKMDTTHGFRERCDLLQRVQFEFRKNPRFAHMESEVRKTVAGLPNSFDVRWAWFGSMRGAGCLYQAVNRHDEHLSRALDIIPLQGIVSRSDFDAFIAELKLAFPKGRHGVGIATRLLAMKRPDQFVCFDAKNRRELSKDFGIKLTGMGYQRYWDEVVEQTMDSPWWDSPRPHNHEEGVVWDGRAAMLDAIFYRP